MSRTVLVPFGMMLVAVAGAGAAWACAPVGHAPSLTFSVDPERAAAGETVTVAGSDFNGPVDIRWDANDGDVLATTTGTSFSVTVTVPESTPGQHLLVAMDGDTRVDVVPLEVLEVQLELGSSAGSPQTAATGQVFPVDLEASVSGAEGVAAAGVDVTFTIPDGAGTFAGGATTVTVESDADGRATAPSLTAGATSGRFEVEAAAGSATTSFSLTSTAADLRAQLGFACSPGAAGAGFVDLEGNMHLRAIDCIAAAGITQGGPAGLARDHYGPHLDVTRASMASFLARMLDDIDPGLLLAAPGNAFPCDVGADDPHFDAIQRLARAEVVLGGPGGSDPACFGPDQLVERGQVASFLNRAIALATGSALESVLDHFGDDGGSIHERNINGVASQGIAVGGAGAAYVPNGVLRRDQMASLVARTLDLLVEHRSMNPVT
jgi:hypothetical protein